MKEKTDNLLMSIRLKPKEEIITYDSKGPTMLKGVLKKLPAGSLYPIFLTTGF